MTPALHEALVLVCEGIRDCQIADRLGITEVAAKDRVRRLLSLYAARNRTHLAALAIRRGDA